MKNQINIPSIEKTATIATTQMTVIIILTSSVQMSDESSLNR
ncbi:hypothetical protein [Paenibacillus sp. UNC451MF]|nr:hypothetical protein [Paenibacillus sp. UNC451MF]